FFIHTLFPSCRFVKFRRSNNSKKGMRYFRDKLRMSFASERLNCSFVFALNLFTVYSNACLCINVSSFSKNACFVFIRYVFSSLESRFVRAASFIYSVHFLGCTPSCSKEETIF